MKVFDIMSTSVDSVGPNTKVKDVCRIIFGRGINGVPVCKNKKIIGFITEKDILSKFFPSMQEYVEDPFHEGNFVQMEGKVDRIFSLTAEKIMSKNPVTVSPNTPLLKAQSMMFVNKIGRLPVVDNNEKLVGMITNGDIFRATVGDKLPFSGEEEYHDWQARHYDIVTKWDERLKNEIPDLRVTTSLDLPIQTFAQDAVATEVAKLRGYSVSNGSAMISNPATGEILAMVGSKNYFDKAIDGNVNVTIALRQPGSSIKPINYAVGLIHGYTAATPFIDQQTCFPNQGGRQYCPVNYDGKFHGVVQMRYALGNSFNIPAVKMLKVNGIPSMIATASAMGITTFKNADNYGLSLTLGGGEVTMVDMTQAFGVFANGGYRIDLHPILKITDRNGKVLEEYKPPASPIFGKKVLPPGVSFVISNILADNNARVIEFGSNSELKIPNKTVSVKTGTTNDFRDNWTIGYTPSFVVSTWVGNNDNHPMSGLASGITGAAPIWNTIMTYLLKDMPDEAI